MNIVGIVDAQQTVLTDTGSYYLPGDKLTVSKLGGTGTTSQLTTWLYNVKKLIEVTSITFGGVNNQSATVTCSNPHGLLVGDQVTVYGANPIIYNGTFLVTSRDSATVFQYQLPQPATTVPQGNILVSIDLNKGKSVDSAVSNAIGPYTTNIQNTFFNDNYVYVASTGIPNYNIGPFPGSAFLPGNQRKLNRFPTNVTISPLRIILHLDLLVLGLMVFLPGLTNLLSQKLLVLLLRLIFQIKVKGMMLLILLLLLFLVAVERVQLHR